MDQEISSKEVLDHMERYTVSTLHLFFSLSFFKTKAFKVNLIVVNETYTPLFGCFKLSDTKNY